VVKRLVWLVIGMVLGAASSWRINRALQRLAGRYAPDRVLSRGRQMAGRARAEVAAAAEEGRRAMRQREAELRGELEGRSRRGTPSVGGT
jgi:hypothetical protein